MQTSGMIKQESSGAVVYPITKRLFDIFVEDGWENHSRYWKGNDGFQYVSGARLSEVFLNELKFPNESM